MRVLPAAIAVFFMLILPALAQTPIPVTVPDTVVTVPYGSWFNVALDYVQVALFGLVMWAMRRIPARLQAILLTMQAEQLLKQAIAFGLNSIAGAAKDKVLTVDVRNKVLKEIVTFVLVHGSKAVVDFMGKPTEIAEKGFARLDVPAEESKPDFVAIAARAEVAANIKGATS